MGLGRSRGMANGHARGPLYGEFVISVLVWAMENRFDAATVRRLGRGQSIHRRGRADVGSWSVVDERRQGFQGERTRCGSCAARYSSAQLVVGSVLAGRSGLAAAARRAADVILLGEMTWAQGAELCKLSFDLFNAPLDRGLRVGHGARKFNGLWGSSRQLFTPIADKCYRGGAR
jgi:hypothetical protein